MSTIIYLHFALLWHCYTDQTALMDVRKAEQEYRETLKHGNNN